MVFYYKIIEEMSKLEIKEGYFSVMQAHFQADSVLACSILSGQAIILLLSADSNLACLLGHKCLSIKKYCFNDRSKQKTVHDMDLFSACLSTIKEIVSHIKFLEKCIIPAKKLIFEFIEDMNKMRSLMTVEKGCDIFLQGVPSVTAKVLMDLLQEMKRDNLDQKEYYHYTTKNILSVMLIVLVK
jgi:hypothetical protein